MYYIYKINLNKLTNQNRVNYLKNRSIIPINNYQMKHLTNAYQKRLYINPIVSDYL